MKKESIMRLGLATLAITMISTSLLSGTLAKYTGTVTAIAGDLAAMSTAISVKNTSLAMTNGTATYTIGWNWATTSDAADTAIGTATTAPTIKLTVGVTIDQLAAVPASN